MNKNPCLGCGLYDPDYGCRCEHDWECPDYDGPLSWEAEEVTGDE